MNINFKKLLIPGIIAFFFVLGIILIIVGNRYGSDISYNNNYYINLNGDSKMILNVGSEYIEPGYKAANSKGEDLTSSVIVEGSVNTNKAGEYVIKYILKDTTVTRTVIVLEKEKGSTYIHLLGDLVIYLKIGEKYVEPGYEVIDTKDGDSLKDKVKIDNPVNTSKVGVYKITYSVVNSSGITTSKQRTVIVMDSEVSLTLDNNNYTNDSVNINIYVKDTYYDHMILPNGNKITENKYTYSVSENGTYKFTIYNFRGDYREAAITINNINKTKPTGSCTGEYRNGTSTVKINASDDIGIAKYVINGNAYATNEITVSGEQANINVDIYDKAGNTTKINCSLTDKNPKISASCSGSYQLGESTINITASSDYGIAKYVINGKTYTTNKITINEELPTVKVTVYDKKNQTKEITCNLKDRNGEVTLLNVEPGVYKEWSNNLTYFIYFPKKATTNLPLIIWLHGDHPREEWAKNNHIPQTAEEAGKPVIMIVPFAGRNFGSAENPGWYEGGLLGRVKAIADEVCNQYQCNRKRIIVGGHSRGATGTWMMVSAYPNYFHAAIPVSCCSWNRLNPTSFTGMKVWAWRGTGKGVDYNNDDRYACMQDDVNKIIPYAKEVKYTIQPNTSHEEAANAPANSKELIEFILSD